MNNYFRFNNKEHQLGPISLIVMQSIDICNIECEYCYLPSKKKAKKMEVDGFSKIITNIKDSSLLSDAPLLLWHAGEPLTMPLTFYQKCSEILHKILPNYNIKQSIQTNGILLNDEWCKFFNEEKIHIGISIDGPQFIHDLNRKTKNGNGTFDKVMEGLCLLRKHDVSFSAICVLTSFSLDYAYEIYDFFENNKIAQVGFNIEETEGINVSTTLADPNLDKKYRKFMKRMCEFEQVGNVQIRELANIRGNICGIENKLEKKLQKNTSLNRPLSIITIATNGDSATFAPELLGCSTKYGNFIMGNLIDGNVEDFLNNNVFLNAYNDILIGRELCRKTCEYFCLCGGGSPSNKINENGTLSTAETEYCKIQIQPNIDIVLAQIENELFTE